MFDINFDQIGMDKAAFWTVIAALAASVISIIASAASSIFTMRSVYKKEVREAFRRSFEADLQEISAHTHQIMASSDILAKQHGPSNAQTWRGRAKASAAKIDSIRVRLRYQLKGIDPAFRIFRRIHWWVDTMSQRDPERTRELLNSADDLRQAFDAAIFSSFSRGRPPSWWHSRVVRQKAEKTSKIYSSWRKSQEGLGNDATIPEP